MGVSSGTSDDLGDLPEDYSWDSMFFPECVT